MSSRWQMCSRCGVKLIQETFTRDDDAVMRRCPICKKSVLTVKGELLKEMEEVAKKRKMTTGEVLEEAIKKLEILVLDMGP